MTDDVRHQVCFGLRPMTDVTPGLSCSGWAQCCRRCAGFRIRRVFTTRARRHEEDVPESRGRRTLSAAAPLPQHALSSHQRARGNRRAGCWESDNQRPAASGPTHVCSVAIGIAVKLLPLRPDGILKQKPESAEARRVRLDKQQSPLTRLLTERDPWLNRGLSCLDTPKGGPRDMRIVVRPRWNRALHPATSVAVDDLIPSPAQPGLEGGVCSTCACACQRGHQIGRARDRRARPLEPARLAVG